MMKQEYIVIPKQNEWLQDLIGKSYNQKLIHQAAKKLFIKHGLETGLPGLAKAIVTVTDTKTKEILGIGGSSILENIKTGKRIADITTDNWGRWFAGLMVPVNNLSRSFAGDQINGATESLRAYLPAAASSTAFNFTSFAGPINIGSEVQVGSGTSAPARTDVNIETNFGSAPENGRISTVAALYDQPSGSLSTVNPIGPTGGTGTVSEAGFFFVWHRFLGSAILRYLHFHDSISPGVSFIAAQTITLTYTIQG